MHCSGSQWQVIFVALTNLCVYQLLAVASYLSYSHTGGIILHIKLTTRKQISIFSMPVQLTVFEL